MERVLNWLLAIPRFLYHFIVGDDWTVAVAVLLGLAVSAILNVNHVLAWWLIPVIVVVMTGISLRRAASRLR
jgi:hypothetical protein